MRQKLRDACAAAEISPIFEPNVSALEKAQPKDLDASEIDVRLGATWVDKKYIQQFMEELFEIPFYQRRAVQLQYSNFTSEWRISGKTSLSYNNVPNNLTYGTDRASGLRILEDTLNLRDVRIYDTIEDADGKERRVLNARRKLPWRSRSSRRSRKLSGLDLERSGSASNSGAQVQRTVQHHPSP